MARRKAKENVDLEKVLDSYEGWLERQRPKKPVVAKHGFIADAKIEEA